MTCADIETDELAEAYLLGQLADPQAEAFEQHYFSCQRCYDRLQILRAVRGALATSAGMQPAPPARATIRWPTAGLAAAAAVILAAGLWAALSRDRHVDTTVAGPPRADAPALPGGAPGPASSGRDPAQLMARLGEVTAPPYAPARLRQGLERRSFDAAMKAYVAGDYGTAVTGLSAVVKSAPEADDARFYLGASHLLAGNADAALAALAPLTNREDSAYVEEARYLSAKALLRKGDARAARNALDRTIALGGDRAREARELRRQLEEGGGR
jgi:TolA-binding protein